MNREHEETYLEPETLNLNEFIQRSPWEKRRFLKKYVGPIIEDLRKEIAKAFFPRGLQAEDKISVEWPKKDSSLSFFVNDI